VQAEAPKAPAPEQQAEAPREEHPRRERGGRGRNQRDDRGPKIVGMGEHVPTFIAKSFEDRMTG
jgi:ATP-dependent RNA helicase RhlE